MKTLQAALTMLFLPLLALAQTPLQLPAPALWGKTEAHTFRVKTPHTQQDLPLPATQPAWLNYNPALPLPNNASALQLSLDGLDLTQMHICTAFHPADTLSEQCAWYIEKNARTRLLLTTKWMADLQGSRYFPLPFVGGDGSTLSTYAHTRLSGTEPSISQTLVLGARPVLPDLPLQPLQGCLPEILLYNQRLSPEQQQSADTYLALKYGLTLSTSYTSGLGNTLWDATRHAPFHHRLLGIGRDDVWGLMQRQSTSSAAPGLLTLSAGSLATSNLANATLLPDQTFLICGDNNAACWPDQPSPGTPTRMLRHWKMQISGEAHDILTEVRFDPKRAGAPPLLPGHIWWLCIDRSGSGLFDPHDLTLIPASPTKPNETAVFPALRWDVDKSGSDIFSLASGPQLLARYWTDQPICSTGTPGQLHIAPAGGLPPYQCSVRNTAGTFEKKWITDTDAATMIPDLAPGEYTLSLSDATGQIFQETTWVQANDAPWASLASRYWMTSGQPLHLQAGTKETNDNTTCLWSGPGGFQNHTSAVSITQAGHYRLEMEQDGCISRHDFEVLATAEDPFRSLLLLPNPVSAGADFQLFIEMEFVADLTVEVLDEAGRSLSINTLRGSDRYAHSGRIESAAGTCQVVLRCDGFIRSLPLVVLR